MAVARLERWTADIGGGASLTPLVILFGLNLVDEFDRIAFAALTPEIRDAFKMSDGEIVAIGAISAVFILFAALPLGYIGDRLPRTRIAGLAAVIWGSMALLTSVAWAVPVLFGARLFGGVARTSNEVIHPSLLADYYEPVVHPRVFQIHRLASPLSAAAALLAGAIGATLGWRWAFVLMAIPTFVFLIGLVGLREPHRGRTAVKVEPPRIPFAEARHQLFAIRSLKRMWLGGFLLGIAFIAIAQLLSLYFEDVYDFGPFQRGVVQFAYGSGIVAGIFISGVVSARATTAGDFPKLAAITGMAFVHFGLGVILMAVTPWAWVSVVEVFIFAIGFGAYQPSYYPLVARIAPARVRTQAYAYALLFVAIGGLFSVPLARLGEEYNYRLALGLLAVVVSLAGVVAMSARQFVAEDIARADAALVTG